MTLKIVILITLFGSEQSFGFILDWFGLSSKSPRNFSSDFNLLEVPYEELAPEEKFLVEASKITGLKLDRLDICQHKLIVKLKSSCGSLSDEELSKLAVNLLNCQADIEGRRTYLCEQAMSLKECTNGMDGETWNAYHIMSNRARAVCYAARQEQFRALAEITVNRLLDTAKQHTNIMADLFENQSKLGKSTELALDRIIRSQHKVLSTYALLKRLESDFSFALAQNSAQLEQFLKKFIQEEAQVLGVFDDLKKIMEEATHIKVKQNKDNLILEEKVLNGLTSALKSVESLNKQLGVTDQLTSDGMKKFVSQFEEADIYLKSLNNSLFLINSRLGTLERMIDHKTSLILSFTGLNGANFDQIILFSVHGLCLVSGMLVTCFLDLPKHLRALLILMALANSYFHYIDHQYAIQPVHLYMLFFFLSSVDLLLIFILKYYNRNRKLGNQNRRKSELITKGSTLPTNKNGFVEPWSRVDHWLAEGNLKTGNDDLELNYGKLVETPLNYKAQDEMSLMSQGSLRSRKKKLSPPRSITSSLTSSKKATCSAFKQNGLRCKLSAAPGLRYCRIHQDR